MAVIVGRPGLRPEQTGLHQLCFWAGPQALTSCLSPSNVAALSLWILFFGYPGLTCEHTLPLFFQTADAIFRFSFTSLSFLVLINQGKSIRSYTDLSSLHV